MDEKHVKLLCKEYAVRNDPAHDPDIITAEERYTEEEVRRKMVKEAADFNARMLTLALTGEHPREEEIVVPEPVEGQNIIELPEPEIHPLPELRLRRRCDGHAKAKYKTNAQKRKERDQRRHNRSRGARAR